MVALTSDKAPPRWRRMTVPGAARATRGRLALRLSAARRALFDVVLSPLTLWLVLANLAGVLALFVFFLSASGYRDALMDARLDSLLVKADLFAAALAAGGTASGGELRVPPDRLAAAGGGDPLGPGEAGAHPLAEPLDPVRVERLLSRLVESTWLRARVYGGDGLALADTRRVVALPEIAQIRESPVDPPRPEPPPGRPLVDRILGAAGGWTGPALPPFEEPQTLRADAFPEVEDALAGIPAAAARAGPDGAPVLFAAVPVERQGEVVGALLLQTLADEVTPVVAAERRRLLSALAVAAALVAVLSVLVSVSVILPLRRLQRGVRRARSRGLGRGGVGEGMVRRDVIGDLDRDFAATTGTMMQRIRALEAFSSEIAHELKNPLTSLRSAVETLPLAERPGQRDKLLGIIAHDVRRLDRLISDISAATSLDRDLSALTDERVDVIALLRAVVSVQEELATRKRQTVVLTIREGTDPASLFIAGSDTRLGEVFTNLLDNARSFTPEGGRIEVIVADRGDFVEVLVDDEGPGIRPDMLERIFERFYTDRTDEQGFGDNSGLGLSIGRQIVEAHGGEIFAENRYVTSLGPERHVIGARFTVQLPLPPGAGR